MRHTEFVFPVVVGTCAFYLGKKVSKLHIHEQKLVIWLVLIMLTPCHPCRQQKHSLTSGISICGA